MLQLVCANLLVFAGALLLTVAVALVSGVVRVVPATPLSVTVYVVATLAVWQLLWGKPRP